MNWVKQPQNACALDDDCLQSVTHAYIWMYVHVQLCPLPTYSTATSLMEEMQFGDNKANQERGTCIVICMMSMTLDGVHSCTCVKHNHLYVELEQLRRENQELEESCRLLEQQLQHQQDQSSCEQHRQLQARKRRQEELERRIRILEQQKKRLSNTKEEVCTIYLYHLLQDVYTLYLPYTKLHHSYTD